MINHTGPASALNVKLLVVFGEMLTSVTLMTPTTRIKLTVPPEVAVFYHCAHEYINALIYILQSAVFQGLQPFSPLPTVLIHPLRSPSHHSKQRRHMYQQTYIWCLQYNMSTCDSTCYKTEENKQICIHNSSLSMCAMPGHMDTPPPPTHPESPGVLVTCPMLSFPSQSLPQQRNAWCNSLHHAGPSITDPMVRDKDLSRRKGWQINFSADW